MGRSSVCLCANNSSDIHGNTNRHEQGQNSRGEHVAHNLYNVGNYQSDGLVDRLQSLKLQLPPLPPLPHSPLTQGKRKRKKAIVYNGNDPNSRPPTQGYAFVYSIYKDPHKFRSSTPIPPTGSYIKVVFKIWFTIISEVSEE